MKTENATPRFLTRLNSLALVGVFIILAAIVAVPFYTARSSSLPTRAIADRSVSGPANRAPWSSIFMPLSPEPQPFVEGIATFDGATCTTPQTDFQINEVVCAKASGVPPTLFPWHVAWIDPAGLIQQLDMASTDDQAQYHFTATSIGPWAVKLLRSNGAVRQTATFTVHDTANVTADVFVQKFVHSASASVPSGDDISFTVVVGNAGPDGAVAVHLIDAVPSGGTLVSFTQQSGPACVPTVMGVNNDCSFATLANGDRAEFTAIYNTGSAAVGDYQTSATASSTTADNNTDNNTGTAQFSVTAATGTASCQVICPENINAVANTTEGAQRGAHVSYDDPVSTGDCGSISSTPVSGSFFPVGTTVVTATSETGGGSCTFVITVDDTGTNPPTISCPANQTVNSGSTCATTVTLGTPTTGGDNVTVHGTRSDGLPMYDCSVPGPGCVADVRKTTDLPFSTGATSVVWMATAHNTPGGTETGTASCTQTITVYDVTPPTITAANQTASADANCVAPVPDFSTIASVSDNCACASSDTSQICDTRHDIAITQDVAAGTLVGLGPHTIHLMANDGSISPGPDGVIGTPDDIQGNVSVVTVTFTVNDTTAPTINCPANILNVHTDPGTCSATINPGTATASDNCSTPTIVGVRSDAQPLNASYPKGTTTITWTATDAAGNHSSCVQTITVIDVEPPTISCLTDMIVDFNAGGTVVTFTAPVGSDNCAGATTAQTAGLASGSTYPLGTTTNTFTVTDASGNTASCSFKVTVALTSLVGLDSVTISGSGYADSYNSSGGYPATKSSLVNVLSNGTITIGGSGKVWGNVRSTRTNVNMSGSAQVTGNATAGTTVTTSGSATVLGTRTNNALAPVMTLPSVPACSPFSSNSGISGTYTYNAGTGDLTLSGVNIATLANGNYCFHNITLGNSTQLKVNGPVVIKMTGTLNTSGSSNLNNTTQIPSNLRILSSYSGSNGVVIGNSVSVYALIYSPQTGVNLSGSAPLFGTAAAKTLTIGNSGAIHYDTQLKSVWPAVWTLIFGP